MMKKKEKHSVMLWKHRYKNKSLKIVSNLLVKINWLQLPY